MSVCICILEVILYNCTLYSLAIPTNDHNKSYMDNLAFAFSLYWYHVQWPLGIRLCQTCFVLGVFNCFCLIVVCCLIRNINADIYLKKKKG